MVNKHASHQTEAAILGIFFAYPETIEQQADTLLVSDFEHERHRIVYQAMLDLVEQEILPDLVNVAMYCEEKKLLDGNVMAYTAELANSQFSSAGLAAYIEAVKDTAYRRELMDLAGSMAKQSADGTKSPAQVYLELANKLDDLRPRTAETHFTDGEDTSGMVAEMLNDAIARKESGLDKQYRWPWISWNEKVLPLEGGNIALIAGAEGVGKSTYLDIISEQFAINGLYVINSHYEDQPRRKVRRRLSRYSGISYRAMLEGSIAPEQHSKVLETQESISKNWGSRLSNLHATGMTIEDTLALAAQRHAQGRCDILVIDYLQKIKPSSNHRGMDSWAFWADMMDSIKTFAERHDIPVIVGSQMNKEGKRGHDLSGTNIRGSGEIIDKAQLAIVLYRERLTDSPEIDANGKVLARIGDRSSIAKVGIVKQNDFGAGVFEQTFFGPLFRVGDKT